MDFRTPSRTPRPRIGTKIFLGLILFAAVSLLGTVGLTSRGGLESAAASSSKTGVRNKAISAKAIKKQYALALAEYYAGNYGRAQGLFTGIAGLVPGHLSDDIQFWRAECAFRLGDLKAAGDGFKTFLSQGALGPRATIALKRLSLLASWGG